jgi:hypothetical protein
LLEVYKLLKSTFYIKAFIAKCSKTLYARLIVHRNGNDNDLLWYKHKISNEDKIKKLKRRPLENEDCKKFRYTSRTMSPFLGFHFSYKTKNSLPKQVTLPKKIFLRLICRKYKSVRVRRVFYYGGFGTEHWLSHSATDVNGWIIEGE